MGEFKPFAHRHRRQRARGRAARRARRRSSRREVSSTFSSVWLAGRAGSRAARSCSSAVQAQGVPAGNPATGSMLSHTHSTGTGASICSTRSRRWAGSVIAAQWMPLASSSGANGRRLCPAPGPGAGGARRRYHSTGPVRSLVSPPVAAYQRANSAAVVVLPAPAKACSSTTRSVSNARSSASRVSSRPKNPISGPPAPPIPPRAPPGSAWSGSTRAWSLAGGGAQAQRHRLVDRRARAQSCNATGARSRSAAVGLAASAFRGRVAAAPSGWPASRCA